jgi:type IV secretory pathway VirB10-like protein
MSNLVFRKTENGKAEISQRRAGLAAATRQLLILVNGVDNVQTLQTKGLGDVRSHLDTLLAMQMIEPVPSVKAVAPPAANPVAPPPVAPPAPPPPPLPEDQQRLLALQRRAYQTLQPHFGPDTPIVAQAMLAARSLVEFRDALGGIEAKLAIYMGRKQAAREVDALRNAA